MNKHIKTAAIAAMALGALSASAQSRSAYFLDNYAYGYQLNPSKGFAHNGYFAFPALGSLNVGVSGNVGVDNFVFPLQNGKTGLFLNPEISADKFLGGLKNNCRLGIDLRETILAFGFKGLGGFNNVSISAVANAQVRVPKDLFAFCKEGITNRTYEIGRIGVHADAYAEIALNHSHDLSKVLPGLRIGGTFKFMMGVGNADAQLQRADLELLPNAWRAVTNGYIRCNVAGLRYTTDTNDVGREYIDGVEMDNFSPINGYGIAFDLGATWKMNQDWEFALAFNDLGFISWKNDMYASTGGDHVLDITSPTLDPNDFDSYLDELSDKVTELYQFEDMGNQGGHTRALEATMNLSAKYTLPQYRKLTFGFLNTTRMAHRFAWTDFRLSATVQPMKWIGATINYGIGTFGNHFGWMLNICPKGFNLFLGMDHTLGKFSKEYIPLQSNMQLSLGLNFPF